MSLIDTIVSSAPPGSNPYAYAADFIINIIPGKPQWYFGNIIASGVVGAINLISTISVFIVMWKRSQAGTGVGLWFFRLRYGHSSGVPYIMPNALTMFLFWNLIFMLLMQPYIWLNYVAFRAPTLELTSRMYFWYGFVFIWDAVGMWTSAFGTLYATLLPRIFTVTPSSNNTLKGFLLHPITMNALCFIPPFGLAVTQYALIETLTSLGAQWAESASHVLDSALLQKAQDLGALFLVQKDISQHAFQKNAGTCGGWYLLCIILFTPTAVWLLWVIRDTLNQRTRRVTPHVPPPTTTGALAIQQTHPPAFRDAQPRSSFAPFSRGQPASTNYPHKSPNTGAAGANWTVNSQAGQPQEDDSVKQLRRALLTASLQFSATFICLGLAAGSWLWIATDAGRIIASSTLHAIGVLLTIWVYVVVGCLVNLFIFIRTRRPDDSPSTGNNVPLSAIKGSHASSSQSQTRSEQERKPVYIVAHTTTHVVVDETSHRTSGSDHAADITPDRRPPYSAGGDLESSDSLSSTHFVDDDSKAKPLDDPEWRP